MKPTLGVTLSIGENSPRGRVLEFAQKVESLGYDSLWVGESWGRDVFSTLTQIASNTTQLKLATGIVNVFSRTPALIAQSVANLDDISGGRAILGLGSSGAKVVEDWHGVNFIKPLQRTREYINIINLALSGEPLNYDGELFKLRDFRIRFEPKRKHVPIYLASLGTKNIQLTGELADGWAPVFFAPKHLSQFQKDLSIGTSNGNRSLNDISLAPWMIGCVSNDLNLAMGLARRHIAYYVGGMGSYYNNLMVRYGFVEEAALIKQYWTVKRDREAAEQAVTDEMIYAVSIIGNAQTCREQLTAIQALGVDTPIIFAPFGSPKDVVMQTIEGLAPVAFD